MAETPSGGASTGGDASWFQATARQRIAGFLDEGSFHEFLPPTERVQSPHLAQFDLPAAFDDGVIVGRGTLDGADILLAAQEGHFMGGTFAEVSGAKLVGLFRAARDNAELPRKIVLLMDSGGVRLQEANAGELAVAEVMRAICEVRSAGVTVVALVGGKAGAFGGAGLTAATCSRIVISEEGRTGVTGPEVIETNKGVEEFDSADKALVWATMGGKTRRLIGGADLYTKDTMSGFREAAIAALNDAPAFDLATMQAEQKRLKKRLKHFGDCAEAADIWKELGIKDTVAVRDMGDDAFLELAEKYAGSDHEAR